MEILDIVDKKQQFVFTNTYLKLNNLFNFMSN